MKIQKILITFVLFLMVAFGLYLYFNQQTDKHEKNASGNKTTKQETLQVFPQEPKDKVLVKSVTLSKKGFLVVREMEGDKLSQVVEISKPLDKGTYANITIPLGNADISNKKLIVMIYEDYGDDGVFNDFDRPMLDENGTMTANYVKTGKSLPATITEGDSSAMLGHNMAGMQSMIKVKYTDKGFIPEKIEVTQGSMVEFVNESSTDMWVASAPHPSHTDLPTFDQFKPTKKGSIYRYVFDKKGVWTYHDHINASIGGIVTVK